MDELSQLYGDLQNLFVSTEVATIFLNRSLRIERFTPAATHIFRLVDDLLDVTRISRGKVVLQREHLNLADLVRRTVEDYRDVFTSAGVGMELKISELPLWVDGDTSRGGAVVLSLDEEKAGTALIRVRDNGSGIDAKLLPRLFQPFTQAENSLDRPGGGLGLGLALVRGLAHLHGGEVSAASDGPGKGSDFLVRLPLTVQILPRGSTAVTGSFHPQRVLLIEDNLDTAESLCTLLELDGHFVVHARDGKEGLAEARHNLPDVVFCDIGLPGMNGYEVAQAFRADELLKETFLIALTGYALPEDQQRAIEAGFHLHLPKPPTLDQIAAVLASVPERKARQARSA